MAQERKPLPLNIRRAVVLRDGFYGCQKCGSTGSIHMHHIKPVRDGGEDHPDNLCQLCSNCHREWHNLEEVSAMNFHDWVQFPPLDQILSAMLKASNGENDFMAQMPFHEAIQGMIKTRDVIKLFRLDVGETVRKERDIEKSQSKAISEIKNNLALLGFAVDGMDDEEIRNKLAEIIELSETD